MSDFFASLLRIDDFAFWIILVLMIVSVILVNLSVESKLFTSLFVPGMLFGALFALWLSRELGFSIASHRQPNTIILAGLGIIAGFLATMGTVRLLQAIQELLQPSAADRRKDLRV